MDISTMVSGILAANDENRQLQIATTVLKSTAKAEKIAAETRAAEQASPADPGPGLGDNLDVTA
jgi:hypothetical protein